MGKDEAGIASDIPHDEENLGIREQVIGEKPIPDTKSEDPEKIEQLNADHLALPQDAKDGGSSRTSVLDIEKAQAVGEPEKPPRDVSGIAWAVVVLGILSSTFLFALDNTIVADVQPAIIERFNSISKLPWLAVAFLLGAAGTNLIWGRIFAQFNAKWTYILTVFLFEVGSAVCGAAPSMSALIIGRAICGVGGAGMYCGVLTLLSVNTTEKERPTYIGFTGVTWGLGTVLGPIIGGAFTVSGATWRWAFYINLCIGAICAPVYVFLLPNFDPRPGVSLRTRLREIDYVGSLVVIGAFVSGVMAVSFGGIVYPWKGGRIIGLFCTSGILFIIFGVQQSLPLLTTTARRIFPTELLKSRTHLILFAATAAGSTCTFVPIYYTPLFFQFVHNDSALEAGVRLLPFVVFLVVFCVANGAIMSATGWYFPWYLGGGVLTVIGGALMYTVKADTSIAKIYGYEIILASGVGSFIQASFSVAQAKVEPHFIPLAIGYITCGQIGGATIGLAIANSVFLNQSEKGIAKLLPNLPTADIQGAISGAGSQFFQRLSPDMRKQVLDVIVASMSKTYILDITGGALVVVLALAMRREKLFLTGGGAG